MRSPSWISCTRSIAFSTRRRISSGDQSPGRSVASIALRIVGIERRLVLFEIQRDLLVGDLARQRPREEPRAGGDEHEAGDDAEPEDRGGRELQRLEGVGDRDDREQPGEQEADRAAQRQLDAPAPAHLPDHFEQLRAGIQLTHLLLLPVRT